MKQTIVYITGFRQHAGKTFTSLGIISLLRKVMDPSLIGYLKPVGQELVQLSDGKKIDKDATLIGKFSQIPDIDLDSISPVRLGSGFTKNYLKKENHLEETRKLEDAILQSIKKLSHKRVIIAEGSGHPGVGGIVGLSNADVSNLIDADIIFLSGGGIGKALDMLEVDLSYFLYKKSRVRGLIFNKLIPEKIDSVKEFITEDLLNKKYGAFGGPLRILAFLPEVDFLSKPSMKTILEKIKPIEYIGNPEEKQWKIPCNSIRVISVPAEHLKLEHYLQPRDIVLLGASSVKKIEKILEYSRASKNRICGIVLTCGKTDPLNPEIRSKIEDSGIPALYLEEGTAESEARLLDIFENTKIQEYDIVKIKEIEKIFEEHFDLEKFIESFNIELK